MFYAMQPPADVSKSTANKKGKNRRMAQKQNSICWLSMLGPFLNHQYAYKTYTAYNGNVVVESPLSKSKPPARSGLERLGLARVCHL